MHRSCWGGTQGGAGAGSWAHWRLPGTAILLCGFLDWVAVSGHLASEGCARSTQTLIGAREVVTLTRAVAAIALINVRAFEVIVQYETFRAPAGSRVVGVTVGWALGLVAEHLASVRLLGDWREALGTDAAVASLTHLLALVLAVRPEARVLQLHTLAIHQFIARVAMALKATLHVDTTLRAQTGLLQTVVHVFAVVLVGGKPVARGAHARVGARLSRVKDAKLLTEFVTGVLPGRRGAGAPIWLQGGVWRAEASRRPRTPVAHVFAAAVLHAAVPGTCSFPAPMRLGFPRRRGAYQLNPERSYGGGGPLW